MKKLWQSSGRLAFWLSYPLLQIYLRIGSRTRVLVVVDDSVLLVKGWLGTGRWQLPGGGVHRGEEPLKAAYREVKEETGITLKPKTLQLFYQDTTSYKGIPFKYACYFAKLAHRPALNKQMLEITQIDWLPLKKVTKTNATADTYQAVQAWLKR